MQKNASKQTEWKPYFSKIRLNQPRPGKADAYASGTCWLTGHMWLIIKTSLHCQIKHYI